MSTEDAAHSLRKLERDAFKSFVSALRAQGPLTPYKELLVEHVKYALFIRDHDYIETMQEAVGDEFLRKVAEKLNPSYSCNAQWEALCFPSHTVKNPLIKSLDSAGAIISADQRAKLFTTIGCHNASVKELDLATAKLANVKKDFYIPQQLRRVLADSELAIGRIDVDVDLTEEELRKEYAVYEKERNKTMREIVAEEDSQLATGKPRRGRKKKVVEPPFLQQTLKAQALFARERNPDGEGTSDGERLPTTEEQDQAEADMFKMIDDCDKIAANIEQERAKTLSPQKPKKPRKSKEGKGYEPSTSTETGRERKAEEQRSIDEDLVLVKTAQAMIEDMVNAGNLKAHENGLTNGDKLISTPKKRGRKMKEKEKEQIDKQDDGCARTRPFDFGPIRGDDPNKPIRGNPDKRSVKRKERKSVIVATSNGVSHPGVNEGNNPSNASLVPGNPPTIVIRPRTNSTASANQSVMETSPAKRMRYMSDSSNNAAVSGNSTNTTTVPTIFSVPVRPGRPTTFRPPNVVFPRAASVLSNGARYTVPFSQSSGNPTRPYYGNPGYVNRPAIIGRERPQLHSFARPPTGSVIRFLEPESKQQETNGPTKPVKPTSGKVPIVIPTTAPVDPQKSIAMPLVTTGDMAQPIYQVVGTAPVPYMVVPIPMNAGAGDGTVSSEGLPVESEKSQDVSTENLETGKMETDIEMAKSNESNLVERLAEADILPNEESTEKIDNSRSQVMEADKHVESTNMDDEPITSLVQKQHEEVEIPQENSSDPSYYMDPQQSTSESSTNQLESEVIVNGVDYSNPNVAYGQYSEMPMNLNDWYNPSDSNADVKSDEKPIPVPTDMFPPTSDAQSNPSEAKD